MITIEFSEDEIERLRRERFGHPHPRVQRKMEALLLKSEGLPHYQITRILGVSENTLRHYLREYQDGGIERLKEIRFCPPRSELDKHSESLQAYFEGNCLASMLCGGEGWGRVFAGGWRRR